MPRTPIVRLRAISYSKPAVVSCTVYCTVRCVGKLENCSVVKFVPVVEVCALALAAKRVSHRASVTGIMRNKDFMLNIPFTLISSLHD